MVLHRNAAPISLTDRNPSPRNPVGSMFRYPGCRGARQTWSCFSIATTSSASFASATNGLSKVGRVDLNLVVADGFEHQDGLLSPRKLRVYSHDLIDRVVGNKLLPGGIRQDIIERTDGVPLFVEEITKAVLEAGSEAAAAQAMAMVPSPAVAVPPSLHASLMARLDRLGSAKEVAQIAAALGREFSHDLLAAVVRICFGQADRLGYSTRRAAGKK
jgi:hypothetical protein